jgi:serine/threonine-protein kinase
MTEAIMNCQLKQTPLESLDFETVDYVPASTVKQAQGCRATGRILAAVTDQLQLLSLRACAKTGSDPLNSKGSDPVFAQALRSAAGIILSIGLGAFSLRSVVAMTLSNPLVSPAVTVVDVLHFLLVISVTACVVALVARRISPPRRRTLAPRQIAQYRLIALLGKGGMGEVYLAEHCLLKRPCAIKLIRPDRTSDAQVVARFDREVRATARLTHWNTVEIFDYGRTDDGTLYYVMEYLPGLSLEELLQTHGRQSAERVVHLLRQACRALREPHSLGLIHRDIKPANLFAAERGGVYDVVKVLDYGLVKAATELPSARLTQHGALSGTPHFMSPEQASGSDEVDQRSDIYSLGAVAYALLSGRPPFESRSPIEVLIAHARDDVRPLSAFWPDVPADLENIVLRCLAKKPEDRYQNMDDLEQALSRCAAADRWTQAIAASWWRETGQAENRRLPTLPDLTPAFG